jgi:hypothetical protein
LFSVAETFPGVGWLLASRTHFSGFSKEERLRKNAPIVFKTDKPATCQSVNVAANAVSAFSLLSIVMLQFTTDHFLL